MLPPLSEETHLMMALSDEVNAAMVKKILGEINMDEEYLEEAVTSIKQWLAKRPHLPKAAQEDALLKVFIIGCKSVERAKAKLDNYFTYRQLYRTPVYINRDPLSIDWTKATMKTVMLPGITPDGHKVCMILLPNKEEVAALDIEISSTVYFMMMDSYMREHYMTSGLYIAFDMANISVDFVMKFSITVSSICCKIFFDSFPHRMKGLICFNAPPLAQTFVNTFITPFLSSKIKERLLFYAEDHRSLEKYFPLEMLPSDYQGKNPSVEYLISNSRKRLDSERNWFLNEGSETVNEELRPLDDTDELKGTFRKLQID